MNTILIKAVRWSGWPLLPILLLFLFTGYVMDGRYGLSQLLDEKSALTFHRMLHLPLIILAAGAQPAGCLPGHATMGLGQTPRFACCAGLALGRARSLLETLNESALGLSVVYAMLAAKAR